MRNNSFSGRSRFGDREGGGGRSRFGPSDRASGGFGRDRFGGGSRGPRDRGFARAPPRMHEATCDSCGKACEVPFRPTGEKPVLCNECFRSGTGSVSSAKPSASSGATGAQLAQINAKLDKILRILSDLEMVGDDDDDSEESEEEDADLGEEASPLEVADEPIAESSDETLEDESEDESDDSLESKH